MNRLTKILMTALLPGLAVLGSAVAKELPAMGTAYSSGMFGESSLSDVKASTKVWVDSFGSEQNLCKSGEVQVLDDSTAWRAAAKDKSFTLAVVYTLDFLEMEQDGFLEPAFVFKDSSGIGSELLLLVHTDSGIRSVGELAGKDILLPKDTYAKIARMWLDSLLSDEGLPAQGKFFGSVTEKRKVTDAVLPVFFKQSGACVVSRGSFETMKELNPQVGQRLTVLAQSPNYLSAVVCLSRDCDPELESGMRLAISTLHESTFGKQILMTFRIEGFQPYTPAYMQTTRTLVETNAQLQNKGSLPRTASAIH